MTVKCKNLCPTAERWMSEFAADQDSICLDCLLDDHIEGYPEGKRRGYLQIERKES